MAPKLSTDTGGPIHRILAEVTTQLKTGRHGHLGGERMDQKKSGRRGLTAKQAPRRPGTAPAPESVWEMLI
jgi:hypothetical protein